MVELENKHNNGGFKVYMPGETEEYWTHEHAVVDPDEVVSQVAMTIRNSTERRNLGYFSCGTGNPIDDCWRCGKSWHKNRKCLAECGIGFGRNAIGGRDGRYYVVTHDVVNPRPGTLRYAVIHDRPLWTVFKRDMVIILKQELIMNSFKTIDGRGANVHIANGACIIIQYITNVIIHGLHIHDCKPTGNALVRNSPSHYGFRSMADGDSIFIFGSSHIWVDQNSLSNCADDLVDVVMASTVITVSNNYFCHHNEVDLMGHADSYSRDKVIQVTIAFNHFGECLMRRMPRCTHGYFHVVNNDYTHWDLQMLTPCACVCARQEHTLIESKPDHFLDYRRLNNPWPELKRYSFFTSSPI
ncbi:hypothetical protein MKW92_010802 [Papaver armeniacum]|nr:hypothetical protein MKW92_010802 [Papaver armeniacum]